MGDTTIGLAREQIDDLFEKHYPVLVEVRFPKMATSPDWYLLHDGHQFDQLLARLSSRAELHVSSVWDLVNEKSEVVVTRGELTKDRE